MEEVQVSYVRLDQDLAVHARAALVWPDDLHAFRVDNDQDLARVAEEAVLDHFQVTRWKGGAADGDPRHAHIHRLGRVKVLMNRETTAEARLVRIEVVRPEHAA